MQHMRSNTEDSHSENGVAKISLTSQSSTEQFGSGQEGSESSLQEELQLSHDVHANSTIPALNSRMLDPDSKEIIRPLNESDEQKLEEYDAPSIGDCSTSESSSAPIRRVQVRKGADIEELNFGKEDVASISRTIYVLGMSPVGQFIAHGLAGLDNSPPITLLMQAPALIQSWRDYGSALRVERNGFVTEQTGFRAELSYGKYLDLEEQKAKARDSVGFQPGSYTDKVKAKDRKIDHLIITTTGVQTVGALEQIKHRLMPESTICFVQHGAGVIEEVNKLIFPNPKKRPHYMLGNVTHGIFASERQWTVTHNSSQNQGQLKLTAIQKQLDGPIVRRLDPGWAPSARYLMMTLCRHPKFRAMGLTYTEYLKAHFEFVAVNSVIAPLSVVYDCSCDQLLYNYHASKTIASLVEEISKLLIALPEFEKTFNIADHFRTERLESLVLSVLSRIGKSHTLMLQNVHKGMKTDIDYYNGYFARRAQELGIPFTLNESMINMVKAKQQMKSREMNSYIPAYDGTGFQNRKG